MTSTSLDANFLSLFLSKKVFWKGVLISICIFFTVSAFFPTKKLKPIRQKTAKYSSHFFNEEVATTTSQSSAQDLLNFTIILFLKRNMYSKNILRKKQKKLNRICTHFQMKIASFQMVSTFAFFPQYPTASSYNFEFGQLSRTRARKLREQNFQLSITVL